MEIFGLKNTKNFCLKKRNIKNCYQAENMVEKH